MIRFVRIRAEDDVVLDNDGNGIDGFAWYETIISSFLDWGQNCVWATWEEFEETLQDNPDHPYYDDLERFRSLFRND